MLCCWLPSVPVFFLRKMYQELCMQDVRSCRYKIVQNFTRTGGFILSNKWQYCLKMIFLKYEIIDKMKVLKLILLIFPMLIFAQNSLPDLHLNNRTDAGNEVQKLLKLKGNEIAVSFYTNGGLSSQFDIDHFIYKENGDVLHYQDKIYFKKGKKHRRNRKEIDASREIELKKMINSAFFKDFVTYTQADFRYSEKNHQICATNYVDDAPENFVMITQNGKQNTIMVYLPKNNATCSAENSPLMKFIELHRLFGITIDR